MELQLILAALKVRCDPKYQQTAILRQLMACLCKRLL
jgi:hypothetical protein